MLMVILMTCLLTEAAARVNNCKPNEFFNLQTRQCQMCTLCKPGQALRRTCSKTNDTLCGMINFSFIDPRKEEKEVYNSEDSEQALNEIEDSLPHRVTKEPTQKAPYVLSQENELEWKNLAFALIGVLSVLIIVTTVLVLIICYKVRYTGWFCKSVTAIDQEDAENGYVVIHRFVPAEGPSGAATGSSPPASPPQAATQSQRSLNQNRRYSRPYRPKRRLMAEYTDDVFDSEDSGGSRSLRSMLETIPEKSEGS